MTKNVAAANAKLARMTFSLSNFGREMNDCGEFEIPGPVLSPGREVFNQFRSTQFVFQTLSTAVTSALSTQASAREPPGQGSLASKAHTKNCEPSPYRFELWERA